MRLIAIITTLGLALLAPVIASQDPDVRLQKAIQQEVTSGDTRTAIGEYRKVADDQRASRPTRAKALLHMAEAHRKLGDADARRVYERLIKEFPDQPDIIATATERLGDAPRPSHTGPVSRMIWDNATGFGSPSADGRLASFTDWETGDLAIRDLAAGTSRRLTATGGWVKSGDFVDYSRISPDGRWVAYSWFTDTPADGVYYDLRLLPTTANGKPRILDHVQTTTWIKPLAWTPDSSTLIATRSRGERGREIYELIAVGLSGSSAQVLTTLESAPEHASVSPSGTLVAFDTRSSQRSRSRDIALLPLGKAGGVARIEHPADDWAPVWTPDGSSLFFLSDRGNGPALWNVSMGGGKPRGVPQLVDGNVASLAGIDARGRLYSLRGGSSSNVYSIPVSRDLEAAGVAESLSDRYVNGASGGSWSADGRFFAYYISPRPTRSGVVVRDARTSEERELTLVPSIRVVAAAGLKWFPDGESLLVVGREENGAAQGSGIFRANARTGELTLLVRTEVGGPPASHPSLSADGRTLFYIGSWPASRRVVLARDLASGKETQVFLGDVTAISLSPDSSTLAVLSNAAGPERGSELSIIHLTDKRVQILHRASPWFDGTRFGSLGWSRDGRYVLFVPPSAADQPSELWRVPSAGGPATKTGISAAGRIKAPEEAPGSGRLNYSVIRENPAQLWILENYASNPARR